jgi:hypothetical protein
VIVSRRQFIASSTVAAAALGAVAGASVQDGRMGHPPPISFQSPSRATTSFEELSKAGLSEAMTNAVPEALIRDRRDGSRDQAKLISTSALPGLRPSCGPSSGALQKIHRGC